ncbi:CaiB/BaiF CoA transferase family protein [Niveispirillum sp. KHB5.9]|uniref:CaiB/BaiF CoA transferase family protein n=1 Tax=Niveispirillum sp. KHB5.9 TaxID=3400269 RepID=UPI003A88B18B
MSSESPLSGLRVADFSWVGAGPRATKDLADYGATVIKVESAKRLDLGRLSPPFKGGKRHHDASAFFAITNTGKQGVTINLNDPRGIEVAKRLIAWADVVVENFGKGYMDRIGLSFNTLKAIKPDIILLSVSVAGRSGPLSDLRGYGNSAAALSGFAALSGWPDRGPHMAPFAYGDVVAPMMATVAVLAALEHRRRTGEGRHLDVSQVEPMMLVTSDCLADHQRGLPTRRGNDDPRMAPHGLFPCRGSDQWCAIAVRDDAEWRALALLAGIGDSRFDTLEGRKAYASDLAAQLSAWTRSHDKHRLADSLSQAGIPAEAVNDGRDVFTDAELEAAGHYHRIHHEKLGDCEMPGPPLRFSDAAIHVGPPPLLGGDNRAVFVDLLGMDPALVEELTASGALA